MEMGRMSNHSRVLMEGRMRLRDFLLYLNLVPS